MLPSAMAQRFVNVDHETPMLLPPDLRDWVPADHIVHFIMDAVSLLDLSAAKVNTRGTGSAQYPPAMMTGLLLYSYATGTFSSRRIEALTHENVAVRYLCGNHHPDYDSICKFRRENQPLLEHAFQRMLHCAVLSKVLRVGDITLAVDGTRILANASKHHAVSHAHATSQIPQIEEQIAQLMARAEAADSAPLQDGLTIPDEIQRRRERLEKLKQAIATIDQRAAERHAEELLQHQEKLAERQRRRDEDKRKGGGKPPAPPAAGARPGDQHNFTDRESRIMKTRHGFQQAYNAPAAVEIESRLITSNHVTTAGTDHGQLVEVLARMCPAIGRIGMVLVDSGYYSEAMVTEVEANGGPQVLAARNRDRHHRTVTDLERRDDFPEPPAGAKAIDRMKWRLLTKAGRAKYRLRKQTVEPVFGIIKEALGFRRFHLRGLRKVNLE